MALQIGSGKYFLDNFNGNVFVGTTAAAGVTLKNFDATAAPGPTCVLWNPFGSGKNLILISCMIGYISGTAVNTGSNFVYGVQSGAGGTIGSGAPVITFTAVTPLSGTIGGGNQSVMRWAPLTASLTTACTLLKTMGVSQLLTTATTQGAFYQAVEYFDGTVILPPGTLITVGANVIPTTTVVDVALTWEEI